MTLAEPLPLAPVTLYGAGLQPGADPLCLEYADGTAADLPVTRWVAASAPGDASLLDRCTGPTLDIGCGPGRLTVALARRGVPALGVDIAPEAVRLARRRGAHAVQGDVFGRLPGTGAWQAALLADGNIGIGGNPRALLARARSLLAADTGVVVVETDPPGAVSRAMPVRLRAASGAVSRWFPWAHVAAHDIAAVAALAGLRPVESWHDHARWFTVLAADRRLAPLPSRPRPIREVTRP